MELDSITLILVFSVFERFDPFLFIKDISRTRNIFTYNLVYERAYKAVSTRALAFSTWNVRTYPTPLRPRVEQLARAIHKFTPQYEIYSQFEIVTKRVSSRVFNNCAD